MEEVLTALLASIAGGRRYWVEAPQTATAGQGPYVVLNRVDGLRDYHMRGPSGYVASRVQADCFGKTYAVTKQTARALIAALSGHRGGIIQGIFIDNERDLPTADSGEVNNLFRVSVDLIVHHSE
jgi:hypothetical protein